MIAEERKYYSRHLLLEGFSPEKQAALKNAHVLIIGAGGLGCPVGMYLAGAGVGNISFMDDDVIAESNLHRQVLYTYNDIGKQKAVCAVEYLKQRNPFITVTAITQRLHEKNALEIFGEYDLIIDGSDNFATRYLVNDACVIKNKPFIAGSVVGYEAQVSVFNYKNGPTYRCLFPDSLLPGEAPTCADAGVLNSITGWAGSIMAQEAIKVITGIGEILSGKLLVYSALTSSTHELKFARGNYFPTEIQTYEPACDTSFKIISVDAFSQLKNELGLLLIDVREEWEIDEPIKNALNIPLADVPHRYEEFKNRNVAFTCSRGERSRTAASWTVNNGHSLNVYVVD